MASPSSPFTVYLLRCAEGSLYVGWTQDISDRIQRHNEGRGCSFTASRRPVELLYSEEQPTLETAQARERQIKRWTREKKLALASGNLARLHELSRRRSK